MAESVPALRAIPHIELWITPSRDGRKCPHIYVGIARNKVFHPIGASFSKALARPVLKVLPAMLDVLWRILPQSIDRYRGFARITPTFIGATLYS
jgi:hypothetical protein